MRILVFLLIAGCTVTYTYDSENLEAEVEKAFSNWKAPAEVTCPDVTVKKSDPGTAECTAVIKEGGGETTVTLTFKGERGKFDIDVPDLMPTPERDKLIRESFTDGQRVTAIHCPPTLVVDGGSQRCEVTLETFGRVVIDLNRTAEAIKVATPPLLTGDFIQRFARRLAKVPVTVRCDEPRVSAGPGERTECAVDWPDGKKSIAIVTGAKEIADIRLDVGTPQ